MASGGRWGGGCGIGWPESVAVLAGDDSGYGCGNFHRAVGFRAAAFWAFVAAIAELQICSSKRQNFGLPKKICITIYKYIICWSTVLGPKCPKQQFFGHGCVVSSSVGDALRLPYLTSSPSLPISDLAFLLRHFGEKPRFCPHRQRIPSSGGPGRLLGTTGCLLKSLLPHSLLLYPLPPPSHQD